MIIVYYYPIEVCYGFSSNKSAICKYAVVGACNCLCAENSDGGKSKTYVVIKSLLYVLRNGSSSFFYSGIPSS